MEGETGNTDSQVSESLSFLTSAISLSSQAQFAIRISAVAGNKKT
jgi:hypothetical protein